VVRLKPLSFAIGHDGSRPHTRPRGLAIRTTGLGDPAGSMTIGRMTRSFSDKSNVSRNTWVLWYLTTVSVPL
jgi:hypothetical protein